ncbi:DUF4397 domain-containing protein [Pontibacter vulgaris]|uniref:DUF4397 domain-containing protein n=1 Tax=Pontibacter vulgaris TaxID=2905679 RepID=UPI001FA7FDBD|nr:DUF4397 domain-containing protein [Pontibacter vulgaris]
MNKWMKLLLLLVLPALTFTSCDDDDDDGDALPDTAQVMVVHASPDAPGVDLLIDNTKVNTAALAYPNNTGYLQVQEGNRNIKVNAAGTSTSVINANLDIDSDKDYTIFAADRLSNITAVVLEDNLSSPASGKAHVRFVHLSPDAPAVDVAVTNGPVLFSNAAFKSASAFTPVDAGTYNLEVRLAGTNTVVLPLPNVALTSGKIYTVFAKGFVAPPSGNNNSLGAEIIVNK